MRLVHLNRGVLRKKACSTPRKIARDSHRIFYVKDNDLRLSSFKSKRPMIEPLADDLCKLASIAPKTAAPCAYPQHNKIHFHLGFDPWFSSIRRIRPL
jgi:hypothetical protein